MDFSLLTDEEIIKELAIRFDAIYRFKTGKNISITNFIKILRGVGEVDMLGQMLKEDSSKSIRKDKVIKRKKRVHKPSLKNIKSDFRWEDDK